MRNGHRILLGLDISTKTIGISLIEDDDTDYGKIIELTHINPRISTKVKGIEQLFLKKKIFEEFILKYKDFGIDDVVIEEPLLRSNNLITVSTLLRFNGMISDSIYNNMGIVPKYISSHDARKFAFPELMGVRKYCKEGKLYGYQHIKKEIEEAKFTLFGSYHWAIDKKTVLQQMVSDLFPQINWVYGTNGELKKENFDATDAYVAVLGYMKMDKFGEMNFKTSITSESSDKDGNHKIEYDLTYWNKTEHRKVYVTD